MKKIFKILNPLIWACNVFTYFAHLETYSRCKYEPYDFSKDIKYF